MAAFQYPGSATRDASLDQLAERATALAARLLADAKQQQNDQQSVHISKIARMMEDPPGKALALADQAFRSRTPARIADQLKHLIKQYGVPHYFAVWEQAGLMATYMPQLVVPRVAAKLRHETHDVILPAEEQELRVYLDERYRTGTRLNLNQLGEAILGEREADHRLHIYLYLSLSVRALRCRVYLGQDFVHRQPAQPHRFRAALGSITHRLCVLYRAAMVHTYLAPSGRRVTKFINLDMEEYRDLHLTLEAFRRLEKVELRGRYQGGRAELCAELRPLEPSPAAAPPARTSPRACHRVGQADQPGPDPRLADRA